MEASSCSRSISYRFFTASISDWATDNVSLCRDLGALLAGRCNHSGQLLHTDGVKGVVFVELFERGLVQCGQRYGLKLQDRSSIGPQR